MLTRPKLQARFTHLTPERVDIFIQKIASIAVVVSDVADAGVPLRDADDLPYVNLAITANAAYLVSRDRDLLDLMKDAEFTKRCPQLRVADPAAFLGVVRAARTA